MTTNPRLDSRAAAQLARSDDRIVITGAGGWIGLATLELLRDCLGKAAFEDRVVAFGSSRRLLQLRGGATVRQSPLSEIRYLRSRPTIVLHFAFLTKDRAEQMDEDEYVRANRNVSRTVLETLDTVGAKAVFVASSGAAASAEDPDASPAMRLYGLLKKEDEAAFAGWANERGKRAIIARIFNLSGPYVNKHSTYALASFILDALAKKPIEIRATRPVVRGYVAIRELMSLVFALLCQDNGGVVRFDTGGAPMEMQEIAETVAAICGRVPIVRSQVQAALADEYAGDHAAYSRLLGEYGIEPVSFVRQVSETASFLDETAVSGWSRQKQRDTASVASSSVPGGRLINQKQRIA